MSGITLSESDQDLELWLMRLRALSSVNTQTTGDDVTRDYLEELQEIARDGGKPFQLVI